MIDRKKLLQRLNKGSRLPEYPLLNLYTLVAIVTQSLGQACNVYLLQWLRPVPELMMAFYLHSKNSHRHHLVPQVMTYAFTLATIAQLILLSDEQSASTIATSLLICSHILVIVALLFGESIRRISFEMVWIRRGVYLFLLLIFWFFVHFLRIIESGSLLNSILMVILCSEVGVSIWRYELSYGSSFWFVLVGVALGTCGQSCSLCIRSGLIGMVWSRGAARLLMGLGSYLLMHGSLHQSNLQFEIQKIQNNINRIY